MQPTPVEKAEKTAPAYFTVSRYEAEQLQDADLEGLSDIVASLDLESTSDTKLPLKLLVPKELSRALEDVKKLGYKKKEALVATAREYRRRYPMPSKWEDPPHKEEHEPKDRDSLVLRLPPDERNLLQNIGRGRPDIANRHQALLELAKLIPEMDFKKRDRERISIYLPLPQELYDALEQRFEETHVPRVRILLAAVKRQAQMPPTK